MSIALAVILVTVVGLVGGIILVVAAKFMAVYEDPRVGQITEVLAGANCGGCGYAGCSDYAKAVVDGKCACDLCAPGGAECAKKVAAIMGLDAGSGAVKKAEVGCVGETGVCKLKYDYQGIQTCAAANAIQLGPNACAFGCIGLGDCTRACKFDAIHVVNGLARVDKAKCTGCGACKAACPKKIIYISTEPEKPVVFCSNHEKGPVVMKECSKGCIACGMCVRNCPEQAITLNNFVARIDYSKCTGCGTCIEKCPKKVIGMPAK